MIEFVDLYVMKRRKFFKTSISITLSSIFTPLMFGRQKKQEIIRKNWAENLTYSAKKYYEPDSIGRLQKLVKNCDKLRVIGSRHSFNNIANSKYNQISLKKLHQVIKLDEESKTVTVQSGISYGQLCPFLYEKGYALHNLASLPHISIAGACATATHGSGINNNNLANAVSSFEFVNAEGELITLSRKNGDKNFLGAVVGLGGLGVLTKLVIDLQPTYEMKQNVFQFLPLEQLKLNFDEIFSSGYSVSLFTDWQTDKLNQVWIKTRLDEEQKFDSNSEFFGATPAKENLLPVTTSSYHMNDPSLDLSPVNCTEQMGVPRPWHEILPHFKMHFTPSHGEELQSEYFIPRKNALEAINVLQQLGEKIDPLLIISEIRIVKADKLWMSPCYQESCVTFHFTWKQDFKALIKLLPIIEKELYPLGAKPHWGKIFTMSPQKIQSSYRKLDDFKTLLKEYDPHGKFYNNFLIRNLGSAK